MTGPLAQSPTLGARGGVIGRPPKPPPPNAAKRIEDAAAQGRSLVGVALDMGVAKETLRRWMTEHEALQRAFDTGRERERHELHTLMLRDARDGEKPNVNAMFLLKCRHGYREGDPGEQSSRLTITFNLPGAQSREEFLKTVIADG